MILIKKDKAKNIAKYLFEHYKVIEKIYKSKDEKQINEGYLINKKVLDDLQEKVLYKDYLSNPQEYENKFKEKYKDVDKLSINSYEKIEFTTHKEMLSNLKEKKEYAILNYTMWTAIKSDNLVEKKIEYKFNNNQLIVHLNDAETVNFQHNSFIIINESFYIGFKNSIKEKIEKTFDCVKKYYKFKQSLKKELNEEKVISKNGMASSQIILEGEQKGKQGNMSQSMNNIKMKNQNEIKVGFLIKKEIFKEWEKYTDYENIKNKNILSKNNEEIEEIKEYINKNFIVNKPKLDNIKVKKYKDSKDISNYLNSHLNLILVNAEFFNLLDFKNKNDLEKVEFSIIKKNFINLKLNKENNSEFVVFSYNNIISLNTEINLSMVNHLIELYTFQENLKLKLKQNKKEKIRMKLVNREWISNIKSDYNYNAMCDSIKNSKIIKDQIKNYESINDTAKFYYLNEVSKDLPENFLDDLLFKISEKKEDSKKKYEFSYKKEKVEYQKSTKEIKYINNFEFIDSKLFHELNKKLSRKGISLKIKG